MTKSWKHLQAEFDVNDLEMDSIMQGVPYLDDNPFAEEISERILEALEKCQPETVHICNCIMDGLTLFEIAKELNQSWSTFSFRTMPKARADFEQAWGAVR